MEITKELKQKWLRLLEKVKVNELSPRDIIAIIQEDLHNIEGQNIPIRLRIEYTDGDSFRSYEEIDNLDYIWYNYRVFFLFWVVLGLACACIRIGRTEEQRHTFVEPNETNYATKDLGF